jgi:hypothetical protein
VARGAAIGDFRNDGNLDIVVTALDSAPVLLRNTKPFPGHWLRIKTVGSKSNRSGFGCRVEVKAGPLSQSQEVRANSSFESASDPRLHFGLGPAAKVDAITLHWPSGVIDTVKSEAVDQELVIEEGKGVIGRIPTAKNGPRSWSRKRKP